MKKLITGSVILALALTGAPQAAAFSSGSSSSPGMNYPAPDPQPEAPSMSEVITAFSVGYNTSFENRGYTRSTASYNLIKEYALLPASNRPYWEDRWAANGWVVEEFSHRTADFREVYENLMATPVEEDKREIFGVYVAYGQEVTTVYSIRTT